MAKIFILMGKSSVGKDTVYKEIKSLRESALKDVVIYTTRPQRDGEQNGVEYFFSDVCELARFEKEGKIIEKRTYNTVFGPWHYFTVDDGQIDICGPDKYLIIGTLDVYRKFCEYYGKDKIVPIYIEVEDSVRIRRALEREERQERPSYTEMCRRFLADEEDFSEERLAESGITRRYVNGNIEQCVKEILADIDGM